jgi:hypothetical protein
MAEEPQVLFLLGAGASKGAGLKTSVELLAAAREFFTTLLNPDARLAYEAMDKILAEVDPRANIEDFLSIAQALAQRRQLELFHLTSGLREPFLSIERKSTDLLDHLYFPLVYFLKDQLSPDPASLDRPYLHKLAHLALKSPSPAIFTLNYDLTLETILAAESIPFATGFRFPQGIEASYLQEEVEYWPLGYDARGVQLLVGDYFARTPDGNEAVLRLVKLHGSLDWYRIPSRPIYEGGVRLSPEDRIVRLPLEPDEGLPMMIVDRSGKERLAEPFRILLGKFYSAVKAADVVVVIGYSFSDEHINRVLLDTQVFEKTDSFDLIVVNGPSWPRGQADPTVLSRAASQAWNVLVRAGKQSADMEYFTGVTVISMYAEQALEEGELDRLLAEVLEQRRYRGT